MTPRPVQLPTQGIKPSPFKGVQPLRRERTNTADDRQDRDEPAR